MRLDRTEPLNRISESITSTVRIPLSVPKQGQSKYQIRLPTGKITKNHPKLNLKTALEVLTYRCCYLPGASMERAIDEGNGVHVCAHPVVDALEQGTSIVCLGSVWLASDR